MPRSWNIAEQTCTVPEINYTFQFGSVHSAELAAGKEPPTHDNEIYMKMWDPSGTKCLTMIFDRGGYHVRSELDDGETAPLTRAAAQARDEDHSYVNRHPGQDPATPPRDGYPTADDTSGDDSYDPSVAQEDKSTQPDPGLVSGDAL